MQRLMAYDWPGNIRELRNVIERAVILTAGGKLALDLGAPVPVSGPNNLVRTEAEMQQAIRQNLIAALQEA